MKQLENNFQCLFIYGNNFHRELYTTLMKMLLTDEKLNKDGRLIT